MTDKRCSTCKEVKLITEFSRCKTNKDGLQYRCKACKAAHYRVNREAAQEYGAAYRAENREAIRESATAYYAENREARREYYLENCEARRESSAAWRRNNPAKCAAHHHKRRATKQGAPSDQWTRKEVYDEEMGICHLCGTFVPWEDYHADHVIPLSKGGSNMRENIRVSHSTCNVRKGAKLLD